MRCEVTLILWHRARGMGRGFAGAGRACWCLSRELGRVSLLSAPFLGLCSPEIGAGWERKAARALAPVRLGGKLPPGKWEPDTLGGTGASCCFPFSKMQVCKILMWSHLRKQINPFICVASFPQLMPTFLRELQGWHTRIFSLASGSP